jgi:hypothetical protein
MDSPIRGKNPVDKPVKLPLMHDLHVDERQTLAKLAECLPIARQTSPDQEDTVNVVRFEDVGYETPVDDQPLYSRRLRHIR